MTFEIKISQKPVGYKYAEKLMEKRLEDVKKVKNPTLFGFQNTQKHLLLGRALMKKTYQIKKLELSR